MTDLIREVDLQLIDEKAYQRRSVGCLVLSHDNQLVLQQRDNHTTHYPGALATFGGHIESGETALGALVRELGEELGAQVKVADIISLGAITEDVTGHRDLIYVYFWQDKNATITGCYEGEARYYQDIKSALTHPKVMEDVRWLITICKNKKLLNLG